MLVMIHSRMASPKFKKCKKQKILRDRQMIWGSQYLIVYIEIPEKSQPCPQHPKIILSTIQHRVNFIFSMKTAQTSTKKWTFHRHQLHKENKAAKGWMNRWLVFKIHHRVWLSIKKILRQDKLLSIRDKSYTSKRAKRSFRTALSNLRSTQSHNSLLESYHKPTKKVE